jgi:hypothetical protein
LALAPMVLSFQRHRNRMIIAVLSGRLVRLIIQPQIVGHQNLAGLKPPRDQPSLQASGVFRVDPTMQSPIQHDVPFSGGRPITVPSGPHYYRTERWVGSAGQGDTPLPAFADHQVRHELNPYAALGYPMDEMNAPAATGVRAGGARLPAPSIQSADGPEHRTPPPIFFLPY